MRVSLALGVKVQASGVGSLVGGGRPLVLRHEGALSLVLCGNARQNEVEVGLDGSPAALPNETLHVLGNRTRRRSTAHLVRLSDGESLTTVRRESMARAERVARPGGSGEVERQLAATPGRSSPRWVPEHFGGAAPSALSVLGALLGLAANSRAASPGPFL